MAEEREKTKLTVVKNGKEDIKEMNKPTPEETIQFKKDFDDAAKEFQEARWEVSEKGKFGANDVGMFILEFMDKFAFWTKTGWMGMIKMNEELRKALTLADENAGLCFDYQTLEFCAYMLANPGKIGLQSALEFEKIADKYSKIGIVIGQKIEEARAKLKEVQYLQERWAAAEQGFYLADLEPIKEEKPEESPDNTINVDLSEEKTDAKVIEMKVKKEELDPSEDGGK